MKSVKHDTNENIKRLIDDIITDFGIEQFNKHAPYIYVCFRRAVHILTIHNEQISKIPQLQKIVNEYKNTIIRYILRLIKVRSTNLMPILNLITNSINIGIDWQELHIIRKSIENDMNKHQVTEGLLANDLDHTIMPLISIDEYQSKIDDRKVIVIGFYVTENDPAADLAAFIEKGTVNVLDTDVSPAPTEDGYYLVFVELDRNKKFPENLLKILNEIENLTNIREWEFSPLHSKENENYKLTIGELRKRVNLDPSSVEIDDSDNKDDTKDNSDSNSKDKNDNIGLNEAVEFLKNSSIEKYSIINETLTLHKFNYTQRYKIINFSSEEFSVPVIIDSIGDTRLFESNRLQTMLGQQYSVYSTGIHLFVTNEHGYLLLETLHD